VGDGRARELEGGDTGRTWTDDTVRCGCAERLCGDDPLQMKRQRVPRRWGVRVCGPEPEVAQGFFNDKIGLGVALQALRDYRRAFRGGMDELWRLAKVLRVANVMRPYLEAMS
jgi:hypothetical protein